MRQTFGKYIVYQALCMSMLTILKMLNALGMSNASHCCYMDAQKPVPYWTLGSQFR